MGVIDAALNQLDLSSRNVQLAGRTFTQNVDSKTARLQLSDNLEILVKSVSQVNVNIFEVRLWGLMFCGSVLDRVL